MKKDYTVINFVNEYKKNIGDDDRKRFLKTKLKTERYLPYNDKVIIATNIVKSSSYAINNNNGVLEQSGKIEINSPMRYVLFVMTVVNKYTNIEVNFEDVMPEFDAINSSNLIKVIFQAVGDKEINEFSTVLDMILNDFMTNKFELKNYISDAIEKVLNTAEKFAPLISDIKERLDTMSEDDIEKLSGVTEKVVRFIK